MDYENEIDENEEFRKKFIYCILPIQRIIKDFIFENREHLEAARNSFKSEIRSYVTFYKFDKNIFNIHVLNLTRLARSFGLYKESMKLKVGSSEFNVNHKYEKTNTKSERKYLNKKIQNKLAISEFQ